MSEEFLFLAGRSSLDFAQAAVLDSVRSPTASLGNLADWLAASPLELLVKEASAQELGEAEELVEAIAAAATKIVAGRSIPAPSVAVLNRIASAPDLVPVLDAGLASWKEDARVGEALSTIARDAIGLFGSAHRNRIRRCKNPKCGLFFLDLSRPGKRVWCSMARCGNLAKTRGYRRRRR